MNVKSVVKVMNFHALLRVDYSRRQAEKYLAMQDELEVMMGIILNNRNLQLDQGLKKPDPSLPVLKIYIGSDLGFCGSVNSSVSGVLTKDRSGQKIVVGKKLKNTEGILLRLSQEEFQEDFSKVKEYLYQAVHDRKWSGVELVYNHYYNMSSIALVERKIYPMEEKKQEKELAWDDFIVEGELEEILEGLVLTYLELELKIAVASAYASENIMRQNATTQSLNKLEEKEEEDLRQLRKERTQVAVSKSIDSFTKQKALKKGR